MENISFSLCNFRDSITFKQVDENNINYVEKFIKTKLPTFSSNWKSRENGSLIRDEDFFGPVYEFTPNLFEFTPGDRIQIAPVSTYVKNVTITQPQYFKRPYNIVDIASEEIAQKISCLTINNAHEKSINRPYLLNKLNEAADRNATRKPGGYRFGSDERNVFANDSRTIGLRNNSNLPFLHYCQQIAIFKR